MSGNLIRSLPVGHGGGVGRRLPRGRGAKGPATV